MIQGGNRRQLDEEPLIFVEDRPTVPPWRDALAGYYRKDEAAVVSELLQKATPDNDARERAQDLVGMIDEITTSIIHSAVMPKTKMVAGI